MKNYHHNLCYSTFLFVQHYSIDAPFQFGNFAMTSQYYGQLGLNEKFNFTICEKYNLREMFFYKNEEVEKICLKLLIPHLEQLTFVFKIPTASYVVFKVRITFKLHRFLRKRATLFNKGKKFLQFQLQRKPMGYQSTINIII